MVRAPLDGHLVRFQRRNGLTLPIQFHDDEVNQRIIRLDSIGASHLSRWPRAAHRQTFRLSRDEPPDPAAAGGLLLSD